MKTGVIESESEVCVLFLLLLLADFIFPSPTVDPTQKRHMADDYTLSLFLSVTIDKYLHMVLLFQVLCSCSHQWKALSECVSEWWSKWTFMNKSAH